MELFPFNLVQTILFCTCVYLLTSIFLSRRPTKLPPGPRPYPIIGNILQLRQNPHQTLAHLAKIYGPIMHLKIGTVDTIVVSSRELAKQVLQKHDHVMSSRHLPEVSRAYNHHEDSIGWLPPNNALFKTFRRICRDQLFSLQRMDSGQGLRQEKLRNLRDYLQECCDAGRVVDIADAAFTTTLNLLSNSVFSTDFAQFNSDATQELKELIRGFNRTIGVPNLADFFPLLKPIDPQGLKREMESYTKKFFEIFNGIIDQRTEPGSVHSNDFLDALLQINRRNESELSRNSILHFLMDLVVAGTDTTSTTVEWAMAELMNNPKELAKARIEIHNIISRNQQVLESDISRLPYLQAVIKETFRLHPPAPLLVPHKAEVDTEINGFIIPENTQVLVNIWAIGRDPSIWTDPNCFRPERFLGKELDVKGHDFELIPFSSGRRMCPALPLAYRMVHVMVASMIQGFDWKLEGGMKPEDMNMDDKFELSLHRVVPLKGIPVKV